jgi:group I intron endonuclease
MTILEFSFLVMSIPLASLYLSTILIRFALLIVFNIVIYYHIINGTILSSVLSTSLEILGGLFQPTLLSQSPLILMGSFSFIKQPYILLSLIPIVYTNAETEKPKVLKDNNGRAGIYQWTYNESGKIYIGNAFDLSERLRQYYSKSCLNRNKNQYFSKALLFHGHSSFSLIILEYINIENLSKEKARLLILEREQYYLDSIFKETESNTYNILTTAGSSLGYSHSLEIRAKIRKALSDPLIRAKMSEAKKGENNHMFNKEVTLETRAKMSASISKAMSNLTIRAKLSKAHLGAKNSNFGKARSPETLAKMSAAQRSTIFLYDSNGSLVNTFSSVRKAGKFFNCSPTTINKYTLTQ